MSRDWIIDVVARLPQGAMSRAVGWVARRRSPRLGVEVLKRGFAVMAGVNMRESAEPIGHFATLEDLFTRALKPGARRFDPKPDAILSPVDGVVGACGTVTNGTLLQIKGREYSLARLLGDSDDAAIFEGGVYMTFYLAPGDYHRVHAPFAGRVVRARVIPGRLFPVFEEARRRMHELFARNERLVTFLEHERIGEVALVKVGATGVGRISVTFDALLRTNDRGLYEYERRFDPPKRISKGAELATFQLGSTVVVLFQKDKIDPVFRDSGRGIRLGERIATCGRPRSGRSSDARSADTRTM